MSSGGGSMSDGEEERYSADQICELIEAMGDADLDAVKKASWHFAGRTGMEPEDLQQEAFMRAIDSRTCKVGIDIAAFICGIMKSIVSDGPRARKKARLKAEASGRPVQLVGVELEFVGDYDRLGGLEADTVSPEDAALSATIVTRELERAMNCISDDDKLLMLVMGIDDGLVGEDLEDLLDTDTKGLAALRKRLGRRLAARYPDGRPV